MSPNDRDWFDRLDALFTEARKLPAGERSAFVGEACGDDAGLRAQLEDLLARDVQTHDLLDEPLVSEPAAPATPESIGPYRIEGILGVGGMGVVYRAQQSHPRRTVALKMLQAPVLSDRARRRFDQEAQLLGQLQHPSIAQIYEAGATGAAELSQPYLVMEYVDGVPVTQFADEQAIGTRERLALVVKICAAVHFAHTGGVIHRDIKPANILITKTGEPKVLDFGVARAVGPGYESTTLRTDVGQLIGTLPYMSPEQVAGDPTAVDTRSDVYALGVLCYELLAGRLPLDLRDRPLPEAAQMIREVDPTPLSSVSRFFRGDLDRVVSKALEKDPDRRYQSAANLAADIDRYLRDEPVVARPPSTWYQLVKFSRRNRSLVTGVTALVLILAIGATTSTMLWLQTRRERDLRERQRVAATWDAYVANIAAADVAIGQHHDLAGAAERLAAAPAELRGWEWRNLAARLDGSRRTLRHASRSRVPLPHPTNHLGVAVSPDGLRLASGGHGGTIRIWDPSTGAELATGSCDGDIRVIEYAPDGARLAVAHGAVTIVDAITAEPMITLSADAPVHDLAWLPDGRLITAGADGTVRLRDPDASGVEHALGAHDGPPNVIAARFNRVATSADGALAVSIGGDNFVRVWDVATGRALAALTPRDSTPESIAISPDGVVIAAGLVSGVVSLWDAASFEPLRTWQAHRHACHAARFTEDGRRLITSSRENIRIWDLATQRLDATLLGHERHVFDLAMSPDGTTLVSGSWDGTVKLWDAHGGDVATLRGHPGWIWAIAFDPASRRVVSGGGRGPRGDASVRVWDLATHQVQRELPLTNGGYAWDVQFAPDGRSVAFASVRPTLWDLETGDAHPLGPDDTRSLFVSFSPDGGRLAASDASGVVRVFDVTDRREIGRIHAPGDGSAIVRFSPDGRYLAVMTLESPDQPVALHDARTLELVRTLPAPRDGVATAYIASSGDGELLAAGRRDGTIVIWPTDGSAAPRVLRGAAESLSEIAFNPDGSRLAAASNDLTVRLFDVPSGRCVAIFHDHASYVLAVAFSPDGRRLASASGDQTIRLREASAEAEDASRSR